jgi:hypothetical protein
MSAFWISLGLAALLNLRQVYYLAKPANRFMLHWERSDALALIADICLTAAALYALCALLGRARSPLLRRLRAPLLVFVAVSGALATLTFLEPPAWTERAGWGAAWGLAALVFFRAGARVERFLLRAGLVGAPVALATFAQLLSWTPWGDPLDPLEAPAPARTGKTPTYVFVFDGWSYEESAGEDGRFHEFLPSLRALAAKSLVFQRAVSPWWETELSLPRLVFGRDEAWSFEKAEDEAFWVGDGQRQRIADQPSIFTPFARAGYHTVLTGFYLPYRRLLGPDAQVVRSEPHLPRGGAFLERMQVRALSGARFLVGPGSSRLFHELYQDRYSEHWYRVNRRVFDDAMRVLEDWPDATFLFAHAPLPHAPFVFDADGSYRGPYRGDRDRGTRADYRLSLRYLDLLVGEIAARLEARDRFDQALLVLTSDHGWKRRDRRVLHVPLILKLPYHPALYTGAFAPVFRTLDLAGLLEGVASGQADLAWTLDYLSRKALPE